VSVVVDERYHASAGQIRLSITQGECAPPQFRAALSSVPALERDAWIDAVFGLDELLEDGSDLPAGCVPYLPCAMDVLLRVADLVPVRSADVFVDIGSGVGRAAVVMHLLTGASVIGIEVQSGHVNAARALTQRLGLGNVTFVQGDAVQLTTEFTAGSVFFLYCPFSGERLVKLLGHFEALARIRSICVCAVDLPLPPCQWLERVPVEFGDLAIYRSSFTAHPP
jgi:SAM-dependent methyltransferase